jgi:hypothetical protein
VTLLALASVTAACGAVQMTPQGPIGAGTLRPTQEDRDAGLVGIASGLDLSAYRTIAVDRFAVSDPDIKNEDDRKLAAEMPAFLQSELVRRLRASGLFNQVINLGEPQSQPGTQNALRLEGTITQLTGGSRALRFWISFGAGSAKMQVETRFVDLQSGQAVLATADRRIAAVSEAMSLDYGGDSAGLLKQAFDNMARDLVRFLGRLARGEAPKPKA